MYTVLAAGRRPLDMRARLAAGAIGVLVTTAVMVAAPWPAVIALGGMGFGAAIGLVWATLLTTTLRLRPGQVGTTQAVISGLSTVRVAIPPLIGLAADRLGLGTAMWLFALAPVFILLLVVTSREAVRA
jgi:hypothetical protein